jgi:hypothetical protein
MRSLMPFLGFEGAAGDILISHLYDINIYSIIIDIEVIQYIAGAIAVGTETS